MCRCSRGSPRTGSRTSIACTISTTYSGLGTGGPGFHSRGREGRVILMDDSEWPASKKCQQGLLIPLSNYGRDGAPITYKAWVCSNPDCGFNIRIDNGEISFGRTIGPSTK